VNDNRDERPKIELYMLTLLIDTAKNLEAAGVSRLNIDTVIHTHGHENRVGGNTDASGKLAFPNACYRVFRKE
jgi:glyoxylase-like metal-dependent hydrolase (beta-lactamase superfamily II)